MATLNVNRSVTDQFYRYKMPRLVAKVRSLPVCFLPREVRSLLLVALSP